MRAKRFSRKKEEKGKKKEREGGRERERRKKGSRERKPFSPGLGKSLGRSHSAASQSMSWFPSLRVTQHLELCLVKTFN